jgi:hypothetical protein
MHSNMAWFRGTEHKPSSPSGMSATYGKMFPLRAEELEKTTGAFVESFGHECFE